MVLRRLIRRPVRAAATMVGLAAGMALSVAMVGVIGAFDRMLELSFEVIDSSDATVSFVNPLSDKAVFELQGVEGVIEVEPFRIVPAILRSETARYRGAIQRHDRCAEAVSGGRSRPGRRGW